MPALEASLDEWLTHIAQLHHTEIELGLERLRRVAERIPEISAAFSATGKRVNQPFVVIVGGTNGKGSTVAMLEHALCRSGFKVGSYTSPHIHLFNERVRIQQAIASDQQFIAAFARVDEFRSDTALTYFEFTTLAALLILAESRLDVVILEVGLGGRLDAVNIVDADLAIVTSIGLDHTDWLGDTLDQIGKEKAGIFREGQQVLLGEQMPRSVWQEVERKRCRALAVGVDLRARSGQAELLLGAEPCVLPLSGLGRIPLNNVLLAAQAFECVLASRSIGVVQRKDLLLQVLPELLQFRMPGRLESVPEWPFVCLDVGHNPHAAEYLAAFIQRTLAPGQPCFAVYSALADKDSEGVASALGNVVSRWYLAPLSVERAKAREVLETEVKTYAENVLSFGDLNSALAAAISSAQAEGAQVLVFGSFYVVEQAKLFLEQKSYE